MRLLLKPLYVLGIFFVFMGMLGVSGAMVMPSPLVSWDEMPSWGFDMPEFLSLNQTMEQAGINVEDPVNETGFWAAAVEWFRFVAIFIGVILANVFLAFAFVGVGIFNIISWIVKVIIFIGILFVAGIQFVWMVATLDVPGAPFWLRAMIGWCIFTYLMIVLVVLLMEKKAMKWW